MIRAPDETARLQEHMGTEEDAQVLFDLKTSFPTCVEADLACMDDPTYRDSHGDSCDFYASLPDPLIACAFPGYRAAMTRCPFACGTCGSKFTSNPRQMLVLDLIFSDRLVVIPVVEEVCHSMSCTTCTQHTLALD
jgi:hypothetical protein